MFGRHLKEDDDSVYPNKQEVQVSGVLLQVAQGELQFGTHVKVEFNEYPEIQLVHPNWLQVKQNCEHGLQVAKLDK